MGDYADGLGLERFLGNHFGQFEVGKVFGEKDFVADECCDLEAVLGGNAHEPSYGVE